MGVPIAPQKQNIELFLVYDYLYHGSLIHSYFICDENQE